MVHQLPVLSISSQVTICNGSTTILSVAGAETYSWSPLEGLSKTFGNLVDASPTKSTTYTITSTVECGVASATVLLSVNPLPTVSASSDISICRGMDGFLSANGALSYLWSPATELNTSIGSSVTLTSYQPATLTVTGTDANGCSNSDIVHITVIAIPTVYAGDDVLMAYGSSTTLTASAVTLSPGGEIEEYSWSPDIALSCKDCASPVANPLKTITYVVGAVDGNSCSASDSITVTIYCPDAFIPDAFSPNADHVNDVFFVRSPCIGNFDFQIYNRWEQLLFETLDINKGWDGKYKEEIMQPDVFLYILKLYDASGELSSTQTGTLNLIR